MAKGKFFGRAWVVILSVVVVGLGLLFYSQLYGTDKFPRGVKVAGIPVQGFTVEEAADELNEYLEQAYTTPVVFYAGDYEYKTVLEELCQHPDSAQVLQDVFEEERKRSLLAKILGSAKGLNYPLPVVHDQEARERLGAEWNNKLGVPAANAYIDIKSEEGLVIVPEVVGKSVDIKASFAQLPQYWEGISPVRAEIILVEQRPELLAEQLQVMGELSSYSTWYRVSEVNRTHNLSKAAGIINGTVLQPGQIFSYNNRVGPRTLETGFRDAPVIVGNTLEPGLGGGICQVSSTLYNAVLLAGLEIVERHNHGLAVSYVPLGMDATVAYGFLDFRFKNNTDYPIYIRAVAGAGKLQISVYGHLKYKQKITTSYVVDQVIPFEYIQEIDESLQPGESRVNQKGFSGYIVRSFRTFYDENGQVLRSELLARDSYKPFNEIIYIGPGGVPDPDTPSNGIDEEGEDNENPGDNMPDNGLIDDEPSGVEM